MIALHLVVPVKLQKTAATIIAMALANAQVVVLVLRKGPFAPLAIPSSTLVKAHAHVFPTTAELLDIVNALNQCDGHFKTNEVISKKIFDAQ